MEKSLRFRPIKFTMLLLILLCVNAFSLGILYMQQRFIDSFYSGDFKTRFLVVWITGILSMFLIKCIYIVLLNHELGKLKNNLLKAVIEKNLEKSFFEKSYTKISLPVILTDYCEKFVQGYYKEILKLAASCSLYLFTIFYLVSVRWQIVAWLVVFITAGLGINKYCGENISKVFMESSDNQSKLQKYIVNIIANERTIRFHNIFQTICRQFERENGINAKIYVRLKNKYSNYDMINIVFYAVEKIFIMVYAALCFQNRQISEGQMIVIIFLLPVICNPFSAMGNSLRTIKESKTLQQRIEELLNYKNITPKASASQGKLSVPDGKIVFEQTGFSLETGRIELEAGKKYLLSGQNGSGKTMLLTHILSSLYDTPIQSRVGIVGQNDTLFEGTIKENICLDQHTGVSCAALSRWLEQFGIRHSAEYYINHEQNNISRGEMQRILILRQLFLKKEILLLDESLNGLDDETMYFILEHLLELPVTVLLVSHQLKEKDWVLFDKIFRVEKGRVQVISGGNSVRARL